MESWTKREEEWRHRRRQCHARVPPVAPPTPTAPRKGATGDATSGALTAATGGALGWVPCMHYWSYCLQRRTAATAAKRRHELQLCGASNAYCKAPPVARRGVAPLRGVSAGGAMAWRGTIRRRKGFGGVEMATYQRAASSSREIFSRKTFSLV